VSGIFGISLNSTIYCKAIDLLFSLLMKLWCPYIPEMWYFSFSYSSRCCTTECHVWICGNHPWDGGILLAASSSRSTEWSDH